MNLSFPAVNPPHQLRFRPPPSPRMATTAFSPPLGQALSASPSSSGSPARSASRPFFRRKNSTPPTRNPASPSSPIAPNSPLPSSPTVPLPPSPRPSAVVAAQSAAEAAAWRGAGGDARARRRRALLLRSLLRGSRVAAVQLAYHPSRATGSAYAHPAAATASVVCDVAGQVMSSFPPGHSHAVIALALHLMMDLLLASPY